MTSRRVVLAGISLVLLALMLLWALWPVRPVRGPELATSPTLGQPLPQSPAPTAAPPPTPASPPDVALPAVGPHTRMWERMAERRGRLHVRCFVGEEFSTVRGVEEGWFSKNVDEWKGRAVMGDLGDAYRIVHWDAPEGASSVTCTVEEARWAYVVLHVLEEDGGPAAGVGVIGCGVLYETGADGVAEFPVLEWGKPCTLDIFRWNLKDTYSTAFVRLPALAEGEERTVRVTLGDFAVEQGEAVPLFDMAAVAALEAGAQGVPDELPVRTLEERVARLEESREGLIDFANDLEAVLATTPQDERWVVEEELARTQDSLDGYEARVDALRAEDDTEDQPQ